LILTFGPGAAFDKNPHPHSTPWRQVHEKLLMAVDRTAGLKKEPKPGKTGGGGESWEGVGVFKNDHRGK